MMNQNIPEKYTEERPWGQFEQFCKNEPVTVKIITVEPNKKLSLQYHHFRDEFWRVVGGSGKVVVGEETFVTAVGDEWIIPKETKHRLMTENDSLIVLEVSYGQFDEDDIVRLEDEYNRITHEN